MSRKPLFWLDKVIKRNGDVTTLGNIISDITEIRKKYYISITPDSTSHITISTPASIKVSRSGDIVSLTTNVRLQATADMAALNPETIGTLPPEYRPSTNYIAGGRTQQDVGYWVEINTDGTVKVGLLSTTSTFLRINIAWVV